MKKILIAYFSRKGNNYANGKIVYLPVGNTEVAAKKIQAETGGDLFEIERAGCYPEDYRECVGEAQKEIKAKARPELAQVVEDLSQYDTIYLGYPNWCGTFPMPVVTFLESGNFADKIILPFCTNEGSGMGNSEKDLREICPEADIRPGLSIRGCTVEQAGETILEWIHSSDS